MLALRNGTLEDRRFARMRRREKGKNREGQGRQYAANPNYYGGPYQNDRYEAPTQAIRAKQRRGKYDISGDARPASAYGQGFEDGCKTYMAVVAAGSWRVLKPRYNMQHMGQEMNVEYIRGFNDAASFCTFRTDWDMH